MREKKMERLESRTCSAESGKEGNGRWKEVGNWSSTVNKVAELGH